MSSLGLGRVRDSGRVMISVSLVLGHFGRSQLAVAITPFKVTDFGTNQKLICDFLLVINSNLPPILHRFQVMAEFWSNFRHR